MEKSNLTWRMWLLTAVTGVLIIANTLWLVAFYLTGSHSRTASGESRRLAKTPKGASAGWQELTSEWVGRVPPGLRFSLPVRGLSIAVQGPSKTRAHRLERTHFHVWILNSDGSRLAFSKHPRLLRLALYDEEGHLLTDLDRYGINQDWMGPGLWDLVILDPGDMMRTWTFPTSVDVKRLRRGTYEVEAILLAPSAGWWSNPSSAPDVQHLLQEEPISLWGPGKITSPRHRIELQ
jgi:hypothetical protein